MIHPADKQRAANVIEDAFVNRSTGFGHEFRFLQPDGKIIWICSVDNIEYNDDGLPIRGYGINQDITEHMLIEEALEESENRFHNMADHIAQLAWMANDEGRIFWYNQRWFDYRHTFRGNAAFRLANCAPS
jgi:PAS domain-containing protein